MIPPPPPMPPAERQRLDEDAAREAQEQSTRDHGTGIEDAGELGLSAIEAVGNGAVGTVVDAAAATVEGAVAVARLSFGLVGGIVGRLIED